MYVRFSWYECTLEGCKRAWGQSEAIFNHIIKNRKHGRNFLLVEYPCQRGNLCSMTATDLRTRLRDEAEKTPLDEKLDMIQQLKDDEGFKIMERRPVNWSAKKEELGDANDVPIGFKRMRDVGHGDEAVLPPMKADLGEITKEGVLEKIRGLEEKLWRQNIMDENFNRTRFNDSLYHVKMLKKAVSNMKD